MFKSIMVERQVRQKTIVLKLGLNLERGRGVPHRFTNYGPPQY